ncbi:MAG: hypothetical protein IJM99_10760 [Firmicutes bacterium]|nr:hypothetical protein [Bacillota bacterium]
MQQLKKKTLIFGMAMFLLLPGTVHGQSADPSVEERFPCLTKFLQILEDWGFSYEEEVLPETESQKGIAAEMLMQVNQQRRSAGRSELSLSQELTKVAQAKAEDMRDQGYFGHTSPTFGTPFEMMDAFGIEYRSAGENIAKGQKTVALVMDGWMNSSGHKENILNEDFTQLGVGYCTDKQGNTYWVQMFIQK